MENLRAIHVDADNLYAVDVSNNLPMVGFILYGTMPGLFDAIHAPTGQKYSEVG